jgi:methionine-rich copper-binding protein CopC
MKNFQFLALACVLTGAMLASPFAAAHAKLTGSEPAAGATVSPAPKALALTFNEKIEASFSSMTLKDAGGKDVASAKAHVDAASPAVLRLDVPVLTPGAYTVQWIAVGHDGHRRIGDFTFTVK